MKKTIAIFLFSIFNLTLFAQSNQFVGDYNRTLKDTQTNSVIEYKLTLNQDGTFVFHSYSNIKDGVPPEINKYGKGKWAAKDNLITFSSDKQKDFDEKYTLDFNNSTARFITKNPRDKTDQIVKTRLTFLHSGIFWLERLDVFKI